MRGEDGVQGVHAHPALSGDLVWGSVGTLGRHEGPHVGGGSGCLWGGEPGAQLVVALESKRDEVGGKAGVQKISWGLVTCSACSKRAQAAQVKATWNLQRKERKAKQKPQHFGFLRGPPP